MEFQSNTDLFEAIKKLKSSLSNSGSNEAGELLAEGMSCLNGLTEGWALLLESINTVSENYGTTFTPQQRAELKKIQSAVHKVVHRA